MKLLFYISSIKGGGAARVMVNIANTLCIDNEVHFVTNFPDQHEYVLESKILRYNLEECESKKTTLIKNKKRIIYLRKLLKKISPDTSISFMGENNVRLIIAAQGIKTKKIISIRNDPTKEYPSSRFKRLTDLIYRNADGIVFQTEDAKQFFSTKVQNKSRIIFNQVDPKFYQWNDFPGEYIIACGRLSKQKNYPLMLDAFKLVLEEYPNEKLNIYGDGDLRKELEMYAASIGITNSVFFKGFSTNMIENYKEAKMLIMTSDYEGMPNVMLEALASSVPVVSTDCPCGGPKMIIKNGINGFLVPVGDSHKVAAAIKLMIKMPESTIEMRKSAYESAQEFACDNIIAKWKGFIGSR